MSGELHVFCGSWHVCPTCHEKKYISHPGEYAFKKHIMLKGHSVLAFFCSWSCLRKWEKEHPEKKRSYARRDA